MEPVYVVAIGLGALLGWLLLRRPLRWAGRRLRRFIFRPLRLRITTQVAGIAVGEPEAVEGFAVLVAESTRALATTQRSRNPRIAHPVPTLGEGAAMLARSGLAGSLMRTSGTRGVVAAILELLGRFSPFEHLWLRAFIHLGQRGGVSLQLFRLHFLRGALLEASASLWHPPESRAGPAASKRHASAPSRLLDVDALTRLFASPVAAWLHHVVDCPLRYEWAQWDCEVSAASNALVELGREHQRNEWFDLEQQCYEMALELDGGNVAAQFNLAMIEMREERYSAAITQLRRIATAVPERSRLWFDAQFNLGTALVHQHCRSPSAGGDGKSAAAERRELVEETERILARRGRRSHREAPLLAERPPLRKRIIPRRRRGLESSLVRSAGLYYAAAATAIALHEGPDSPDAAACAERAQHTVSDRPDSPVNAGVWYNLACHAAVRGVAEDVYRCLARFLASPPHRDLEDAAATARRDPVLGNYTQTDRFDRLVGEARELRQDWTLP